MVIEERGMQRSIVLTLMLFLSIGLLYAQITEKRVVTVPVANIYRFPSEERGIPHHAPLIHRKDAHGLCTQALLGERLEVITHSTGWLYVRLCEQTCGLFLGTIEPYSGWIKADQTKRVTLFIEPSLVTKRHNVILYQKPTVISKKCYLLSCGTKLVGVRERITGWWSIHLPTGEQCFVRDADVNYLLSKKDKQEKELRDEIATIAKSFVGMPFCWYGRSSYNQQERYQLTSVGCDGLVELVYRSCGIDIPRFAADQYYMGEPINGDQLQPGDLLFFASPRRLPEFKPHHAMIYIGNDYLVEATYQSPAPYYPAQLTQCSKRFKKPVATIKNGDLFNNGSFAVFFCSILKRKQA